MFGHQDDIITQDQKRDADVTIPESALDALTAPPQSGSSTDSPVTPVSTNDAAATTVAPTAPGLAPTSIDGFTAPNAQLTSPFSYMQNNRSDDTDDVTGQPKEVTENTDDTPEPAGNMPADSLLSNRETEHDENKAAADYLDTLIAENPHVPEGETDESVESTETDESVDDESDQPVMQHVTNSDNLLSIKQEALGELSPLVGQLNLEPEEKFHTIMMLIRASDNETLIGDAYAAARAIGDEKLRAQALLDVVNEINYFTGNESVAA